MLLRAMIFFTAICLTFDIHNLFNRWTCESACHCRSRSPPRLYAGPPRYYRDSASSHNIYQHPPPAPLNASQTTFAHHRLPALINYPPPSFLQTSNTSLGGFQSMPASVPPSGGYRGARGCVDDRSQRRRSPPRVTETDRRLLFFDAWRYLNPFEFHQFLMICGCLM